jgi:SAM-dependent methyltransferase
MTADSYFASDHPDEPELQRLRDLSAIYDPVTIRRAGQLGIAPGWRCLEVGAGAGSIACWLADRVGPTGRVVAADLNTRFLGELRLPNLEVRRHDLLAADFEPQSYDLVHCRMLLMHLADPARAVARLARAVRPGGWLFIEEGDSTSLGAADPAHPRSKTFDRITRIILDGVQASRMMDCYLGRRVRDLVEPLEFSDLGHEGTALIGRGGEPAARFFQMTSRITGEKVVDAGLISRDDLTDRQSAYDDPTFTFVTMSSFGAWARRPV